MASYNTFHKPYDQIVCEAYALPANGTPVILTNTCTVDASTSGTVWFRVFAGSTTVELANPATLAFHPQVGTTAAATQTFDTTGTVLPGVFISAITASACSTISWTAGQLICEMALPMEQIKAINASNTAGTAPTKNIYVSFFAVAVSNESADNIEAYLYVE